MGNYYLTKMGQDFGNGERPQYVVAAGNYFAAEMATMESFALSGCTVSPGFDFEDFEMPTRNQLTELFPPHKDIIERLTRY